MKKVILGFLLLFISYSSLAKGGWMYSLEEAQKLAIAKDKLILVDFWATWCGPCKKMDSETWSKDEVKQLMDNYIPVKIDINTNRSLAQKYGVNGIPYIFILDANGKVLYQQMSYKTKQQILKLLNSYAVNMQYLKNEYIHYYKRKGLASSFKLANKIQNFSLYTNGELKSAFLNLSKEYLGETNDYLKKEAKDKYESIRVKSKLIAIQDYLYRGKFKKTLKKLIELKESELDADTFAQYCFIKHIAYTKENNKAKADKWLKKLQESGKISMFKKKIEILKAS